MTWYLALLLSICCVRAVRQAYECSSHVHRQEGVHTAGQELLYWSMRHRVQQRPIVKLPASPSEDCVHQYKAQCYGRLSSIHTMAVYLPDRFNDVSSSLHTITDVRLKQPEMVIF